MTGDISLWETSDCLIMTTEILWNKLFSKDKGLDNVSWVIFDEVHYINNYERGSVWEETIIMLPRNINLIMLSATVENIDEFSGWISRITGR